VCEVRFWPPPVCVGVFSAPVCGCDFGERGPLGAPIFPPFSRSTHTRMIGLDCTTLQQHLLPNVSYIN
jgi:hypothetical protein